MINVNFSSRTARNIDCNMLSVRCDSSDVKDADDEEKNIRKRMRLPFVAFMLVVRWYRSFVRFSSLGYETGFIYIADDTAVIANMPFLFKISE